MPLPVHGFKVGQFRCSALADADMGARNVLLVEGEQRILIDTGAGSHDPGNPGKLLARLEEAGVQPASIDTVVLTHADFDHIGGAATRGGHVVFDGAGHWIMRTEIEFWRQRPMRLPPSPLYDEVFRARVNAVPPIVIDALGDRLHLVDRGPTEIVRGVTMIAAPGHTPGNAVVRIESEGDVLLVVADLFYQPENLASEGWVSQYDFDPKLVIETRRRLLDEAATEGTLLLVYHLPFPGLGRVAHNQSAWQWISA